MSEPQSPLTDIPAVGATRSKRLQEAGFATISDIGDAETNELANVPAINPDIARCVRQGARELRGDDDTIQNQIATDCGVPREAVAEAFAEIAYRGGSFETKRTALREVFCKANEESILHLNGHSLRFLFLLYNAGFRDLDAVASASLSELINVSYFDKQRAQEVRATARNAKADMRGRSSEEQSSEEGVGTEFICEECGETFESESHIQQHSHRNTEAKDASRQSDSNPGGTSFETSPRVTRDQAQKLLEESIGPEAEFRPQQREAISRLVNQKERLFIVQRTGWGKSTVYFIATRLLRDQGSGPTLIISPLLSLMRNQISNAEQHLNLNAITINSNNEGEWDEAKRAVIEGNCDLLLISPERLANPEFRQDVLNEMEQGFGMLVIDEAHCISDWGHDFRPDYRRIKRIIKRLPENIPVAATTATANDRVVEDVTTQLPDLNPIRGTLVRDSLKIQTINLGSRERRLAWLAENVTETPVSGIIYCLTTNEVEQVADWLTDQGLDVLPYHGRLDNEVRREREQKLLDNEVDALVATNALGMGFDKPDLGFVIHFQRPPNLIRYYQEIGRAGRDIDEAYAILLSGEEDDDIAEYFIESAFPEPEDFESVLSTIGTSDGPVYRRAILRRTDISWRRMNKCLDILQVEGAISREDEGYVRTANSWQYDYERFEQVTERRWEELERIKEFVRTDECLTQFVDDELDGDLEEPCGHCANCAGNFLPSAVQNEELIQEAIEHYQSEGWNVIEPRKQRHKQGGGRERIPERVRMEAGRALCVWDDPGWGTDVREGKYEQGRFGDDLVEAAAAFIREEWNPSPEPKWIAAVPSTSTEGVVTDFASRLAEKLDIPFIDRIKKVENTRPQKDMENSYQKCWNVEGAFNTTDEVRGDAVLLVDDVVASKWTLTETAKELRLAGSGPVYPFALAKRRGG
ncbi:RecQ family ATP-dependent DNA helicase [Halobaculum rubrum]|uniref:RecQ family ATP-dependent DNA helicase n=1 Tax=Halobaculum rubrum TaxID=2872158 RepID=UPI001CA409C8|nr:RecQ family ATP-dependent DNA helicase [Halobaculum rubrum]QZX99804.1 RecQ family ATP-dependent DNA helicase [Halobaculum rubrum]QZX99841.1 RecQ family ATP-dependent DNA helicase [Halobaculum rubrum]